MSKHPIALLGAGIFARESHLPAILKVEKLELRAIYSRSLKSAQELSQGVKGAALPIYTGEKAEGSSGTLDDLLARDDIKTVVVCLPISVQPEIILKALASGKNVISEKPVGKDIATAQKLIDTYESQYKAKGLQWIVAEQFPYEQGFIRMREMFTQDLGELRAFRFESMFHVAQDNKYYNTAWRKTPDYQAGFLLDGGVHPISALRYIFGAEHELKSVRASAALQHEHLAPLDTLVGLLTTSSGKHGSFELNVACETGAGMSYSIRGSEASIYASRGFENGKPVLKVTLEKAGSPPGSGTTETFELKGVEDEFQAFAEVLVAGPRSEQARLVEDKSGPRATLKDVAVIERALQSSEKDKSVSLS